MKQLSSLIWKEWHEARGFLWVGLGVFLGLPILGGLEALGQNHGQFDISTEEWILTFGGVLAVFVGVGVSCRDFSGHLEDFWRSRPVSVTRWMAVKYVVGLMVVLAACLIPPTVELLIGHRQADENELAPLISSFSFMWTTIYSMGFLAGCLVRRNAHAAMLGLAAMLLLYFLPLIVPPLVGLSIANVRNSYEPIFRTTFQRFAWSRGQYWFAAQMLIIALAVLSLSLVAVQRNWRVESGRKMMYGSVSGAFLILFASAAFQLGTNMPLLQQIDLLPDEHVYQIIWDGHSYIAATARYGHTNYQNFRRPLEINATGIALGDATILHAGDQYWGANNWVVSAPDQPLVFYHVVVTSNNEVELNVYEEEGPFVQRVPLDWRSNVNQPYPHLYAFKDRLYVFGSRLVTLDIGQPLAPKIISNTPFSYGEDGWAFNGENEVTLALPEVPDLLPKQRLEAALQNVEAFDGEILCTQLGSALTEYRLTHLTDAAAIFQEVGQYQETLLERIFGAYNYWPPDMKIENGLLYVSPGAKVPVINPHVTVFDLRGPHPLQPIGHFAAPGAEMVYLLPDGRAIVGGTKLWLIGPPPGRNMSR
jgi:hypothetical protein